ncbi:hypothetical protein [Streptomyces sp. NBC_01142]|uniref:hypothetical protein n=1 Tax=Streptomyces sp. NBC_01142 TaxID=2975865 RepID=UPI00225008B9|nr:hypothetical protein [Streptomyces sp. NBC_01142]
MTPAWLAAHFDALPFPARSAALARYARTLAPNAYAALKGALDAGDTDQRHTALFLAVARRDLDTVAAALGDPLLRRRALSAAIRLPVSEQALTELALNDASSVRHAAYRVLRLSRRTALADTLVPHVHARHGAQEAARLLIACSPATVGQWLPTCEPPPGTLATLARTAPLAVAEHLATGHESRSAAERRKYLRAHRLLAAVVAERDPAAGLLLLARTPGLITPRAAVALLRRPADVLDILRRCPAGPDGTPRELLRLRSGSLPRSVLRAVRALPPDDLTALVTRCHTDRTRFHHPGRQETAPDPLLVLLPPGERRRTAEARIADRTSLRIIQPALAALAGEDRIELITAALERSGRSPLRLSRYLAVLPLDRAEPLLRVQTEQHRAHHRMFAWPALLACAELHGDPQEFARIVASCERAWHDQNDVRRFALEQVAGAPLRLLAAVEERVLRDASLTAVQSRDSTADTLAALERWLRRTTEHAAARGNGDRAAYAARLLCDVLTDPRRTGPNSALRLDAEAARVIWSAAADQLRPHAGHFVPLAELLAPHLAELPELDSLVRRTLEDHDDPELAARAASAWTAPAGPRESRCAELLRLDPSFAVVPTVLRTLAERRTDLLDDVLAAARDNGLRGRVRPRSAPWAPRVRPAVTGRWLPFQRRAWYEQSAAVAADEWAPVRTRTDAAAALRDPGQLLALAEQAPQPVSAAALGALGGIDAMEDAMRGHVTAVLLRHAGTGGARGRAAMASVRRGLDTLPDREAIALLTSLLHDPAAPVGTRKEAARGLGMLPGDDAFAALVAAWDLPEQHRDVRAVLARSLLRAIDADGIAQRLWDHVREPAVRDVVITTRTDAVPSKAAPAYTRFLARLLDACGEGDEESAYDGETAVAVSYALHAWSAADPEAGYAALAAAALKPLHTPRVWEPAVAYLGCHGGDPRARGPLLELLRALLRRRHDEKPDISAWAVRRLDVCAAGLTTYSVASGPMPLADPVVGILEEAGLFARAARLRWEAAIAALRCGDPAPARWERLLCLIEGGPDRLRLDDDRTLADLAPGEHGRTMLAVVRRLRARGTPAAGRCALHLVRRIGGATSWESPWLGEIEALRTHPDHDTALAALLAGPVPGAGRVQDGC